jgi:hypothetical protein
MKTFARTLLLAAAVALPVAAGAQTLYKLIDKNGKVTYSEKPPKDYDGKVVPLNIDPNANTATLPKPAVTAPARRNSDSPPIPEEKKPGRDEQLASAKAQLDAARKALAEARDNPKEGEIEWIGKVGGGARPQPSEGYAKRIADLEDRVAKAEERVKKLESGF